MQAHGYFGIDSITWRIGQEAILTLGGGRAVLMQLAHPLVAMGVSEHSSYMTEPFRRMEHTFLLGQLLTFGTTATAHHAARTINRLHAHVHGTLPMQVGEHQEGTVYDARNPQLLLWVHATLADTILHMYPLFIGSLTSEEEEQYYQESKRMGRLLGLADTDMPRSVSDLRVYVHEMVHNNALAATPQARQIVRQVLYPPVPDILRPLLHLNLFITCGLLPAPIREIYGLDWGPKRQRIFELLSKIIRKTLPFVPPALRILPVTRTLMHQEEMPTFAGKLFTSA